MSDPSAPPPDPKYLAQSRQNTIRGVTWMSVAVPTVVVLARIYTRMFLRKVFGLDDWLIALALALLITYGGVIEAAVSSGLGRHVEWVLINVPQNAVHIALLGQVSQPLVIMSCAMGKTSFIITLLRIGSQRWVRLVLYFTLASVNVLHILVSLLLFLRCKDPRVLWDTTIETTCWPTHIFLNIMYFIGAYSSATDFVLALMPWVMIWSLQMKNKEKAGVAVAMSLGVFAGATAIIKCTYLSANSTSTDPTYDVGELLLWAGAENALILIAASLPTLRPLLKAVFPSTMRSKSKSTEHSHQLKTFGQSSGNFLNSNGKRGEWSAIVESEGHNDQNSDQNSDRSILRQTHALPPSSDQTDVTTPEDISRVSGTPPSFIRKTTQVDVSYDQK